MRDQPDILTVSNGAWASLFALALIWGGSFLSFAIALEELPVLTVVAHRVLWGAVALWLWACLAGIPLPRGWRLWGACLIMGLLNNVIPFTLIALAQTEIESGLAAILNATTAIFGMLVGAMVFRDERLTVERVIGTCLGFAGVVIVIGPGALLAFDFRSAAQIAMLCAGISYALSAAWARARLGGVAAETAALGMLIASSLISVPIALIVDGPPIWPSATTLTALFYISVLSTSVAYLLYYRVLRSSGSANLLLVTILVAPVAILLGAVVLGEQLPGAAYVGFALLAAGLLAIDGRLTRRARRLFKGRSAR